MVHSEPIILSIQNHHHQDILKDLRGKYHSSCFEESKLGTSFFILSTLQFSILVPTTKKEFIVGNSITESQHFLNRMEMN